MIAERQRETQAIITARKIECEEDPLYFDRYFFKQRYDAKMIVAPHIKIMAEVREKVFDGEITRLIVNIPPRYMKTDFWSINTPAKGFAKNPRARFVNLSYSNTLVLKNSADCRDIVKNENFKNMFNISTRRDRDNKQIWHTDQGGMLYSAPAKGQVIGFGAGLMEDGFTGILGIDDPIKPLDANYKRLRDAINQNYVETIMSRIAHDDVPIVLIMQRVHYEDLSGFLLRGGSGEKWHHLELPVVVDNSLAYPKENTHGVPIQHNLPDGWLWPYKHNEKHRTALSSNRRRWKAQYLQRPEKYDIEGALWNEKLIERAIEKDDLRSSFMKRRVVGIDPTVSYSESSTECGVGVASSYKNPQKKQWDYKVDIDCTAKMSTNTWALKAIALYEEFECDAIVVEVNNGGDLIEDVLRKNGFKGKVIKVRASRGKFARAEPIAALYEQFRVAHAKGLGMLEDEMMSYVPFEVTESPNRLDWCVWALHELSKHEKNRQGTW